MNQDGRMDKEDESGLIMYTKAKPFRQEAIIVLRCLNVFENHRHLGKPLRL